VNPILVVAAGSAFEQRAQASWCDPPFWEAPSWVSSASHPHPAMAKATTVPVAADRSPGTGRGRDLPATIAKHSNTGSQE